MTRGFVEQSEMLKLRRMVVELNDNLDRILLRTNRERVQRYIRTHRTFTNAEANDIASMHINLKERLNKKWQGSNTHTTQ